MGAFSQSATVGPVSGPFSRWTLSREKRLLDFSLALPMTLLVAPLMGLLAVMVKLTSAGPALFRQKRVGRYGHEFELLKFRSMRHSSQVCGPGVTQETDQRITPFGRWLRRSKLDELPQLFNVLRGEMSLVGPRPDLSRYLATLSSELEPIILLTPGITSPASIAFRNEEQLVGAMPTSELENYYVNTLLPQKIKLDLSYFRKASWRSDLRMLIQTGISVLFRHEKNR